MKNGVAMVGLYVRDQDEALDFYVHKLGFQVKNDVKNGNYRWLQALRELVAKGAMPPLVLHVDDVRAAYDRLRGRGVELTQEPVERYGTVDAGFRDPSGNGWKMIQPRPSSR